jgi:inositol-pentakisphosphate 2-kinase
MGRLGKWLEEGQPILKILRAKQRKLDPFGVVDIMNCDAREGERRKRLEDLQIAMTLRDVTLFLQIPDDKDQPVVARLGDLDVKSLEKLDSWVKIERQLREEKWYKGRFENEHECSYNPEYHAEDVNWSETIPEREEVGGTVRGRRSR